MSLLPIDTFPTSRRCLAAGATIVVLANKCAAKFVNKSTSQPARRATPTGLYRARVYMRSTTCKAIVCACTRIRNTLKCSPVSRETPPHPLQCAFSRERDGDDRRHFRQNQCQWLFWNVQKLYISRMLFFSRTYSISIFKKIFKKIFDQVFAFFYGTYIR